MSAPNADYVSPNAESWTLIPGDRVLFNGQEWEVFITPMEERNDSAIWIFRYSTPGQAGPVYDLMRQRRELTLIPRVAPSDRLGIQIDRSGAVE